MEFAVNRLPEGYALAAGPPREEAIHTDAEGLDAGEVRIPVPGGELPAYRAMPSEEGTLPLVLVVEEIFGVDEHIQDVCRRLAKLGCIAIAPELFAREGSVAAMETTKEIFAHVVSRVPDERLMADLDATVAYAGAAGRADTARLGITGFCWGGRATWLYAAHNTALKAAVPWYGKVTGETNDLQPRHPVDVTNDLKCPVLGLYAGQDKSIPLEMLDQLFKAIQRSRKNVELRLYPTAGHGFHADYRPSYHEVSAQDAWHRMRIFFEKHGLLPPSPTPPPADPTVEAAAEGAAEPPVDGPAPG